MKFKLPVLLAAISFCSVYCLAQAENCLTCGFSTSTEANNVGSSDPCEDLFKASCMGQNDKSKYDGASKASMSEWQKTINEARNKAARSMGYKDFDDALRAKLKENGIDLKDSPDPGALKNLKRESEGFSAGGSNAKNLYGSIETM